MLHIIVLNIYLNQIKANPESVDGYCKLCGFQDSTSKETTNSWVKNMFLNVNLLVFLFNYVDIMLKL